MRYMILPNYTKSFRERDGICAMSALPPKADIGTQSCDVRFVPNSEILELQPLSGGRWLARLHNPLSGLTHRA